MTSPATSLHALRTFAAHGFALLIAAQMGGCPSSQENPRSIERPPAPAAVEPTAPKPSPMRPINAAPEAGEGSPPLRRDGTMFGTSELMGTTVSINVFVGPQRDRTKAGATMEAALAEMARIETLMSEWKPQSELSKLNDAAGGEPRTISTELFEVLRRGREIHDKTDGAFDITFHGVGHLWSFKAGAVPPTPAAIAAALPLVDGTQVQLDPEASSALLTKPGMKIGLGAIAKGYAVDRASALLREAGFADHVVEAGGDTYASGSKGGIPWRVGVQDPDGAGSLGVLSVNNRAIVTSGDYMRFFEYEGQRYAHILDPNTGTPVAQSKSPKSVTLLAKDATEADGYCTAVAVMGAKKGMAFVESQPDLDAVIIARDGAVMVSSGLAQIYTALPPLQPEN